MRTYDTAPPSFLHSEAKLEMGTNEGWPEAFGFSISGGSPVIISEVEDGGSAQQAGLQPGDILTELDGQDIQQWSLEQVVKRARDCAKVPPSLVVISRIRNFRLRRDQTGGYGITLRGNGPVFVRSVDVPSSAREAGLRSGDLILEIDGQNVKHASKLNVLEKLRHSGSVLSLTVITSGWNHPPSILLSDTSSLTQSQKIKNTAKYQKAANFHNMVTYYLMGDSMKRNHLLTLLRLYAQNRNINSLARSVDVLLDGPIERKLIPAIRDFLQSRHRVRFDAFLPSNAISLSTSSLSRRRGSVDHHHGTQPRSLAATRDSPWCSSLPSLTLSDRYNERLVCIDRGNGSFGFSLSGNAPVFIRSIDSGGAAQIAGLKPGDRILAINGLDIRNATHSHVVRLLKGSGTSPSLLISSIIQDTPTSSRNDRRRMVGGARGVASSEQLTAGQLQERMEQILEPQERELVTKQLYQYSKEKDIPQLVNGLHTILSDPRKMMLFHYICQLLPQQVQTEFDRVAANTLNSRPHGDDLQEIGILEDTAIGSVGESGGFVINREDTLERATVPPEEVTMSVERATLLGRVGMATGMTAGMVGENKQSENSLKDRNEKRRSFENTPVGHRLSSLLSSRATSTPMIRPSTEATPPATPTIMNDTSSSLIPSPPPPTPVAIGDDGIPLPPPLPPPPSSSQTQQSRTMKRVNWQKMTRTDGTVWGELSGLDEAIELAELDSQFALRKSKDSSSSTSLHNKRPSVLNSKKAYNISILLGHLKLSPQTIKEAVLSCNDDILQEQHLRQMEAYAPDKKECLGFARYYGNPSILGPSDQFSCEMSTIPCYKERLRSMIFRLHYQDKVDEIQPDLEAICQASIQLKKSKRLKKILELVLAIGNHMNMGNIRIGQAQGFHIGFLSQLHGLRTTDGRSTLLHYLAGLTERKFPEVLTFHEDITACTLAARVSDQTLEIEMSELSQGLQDIRRFIKEIDTKDELPGDRFHDVMTNFLTESEGKMTELLTLYSQMKEEYKQIVIFYGEDPTKMRIDDFFTIFASFITDFKKAVNENRQNRLEEMKKEQLSMDRGTARRRGQSSKPHPPDRDQYQQFKEELEKTRLRPIPHDDRQTGMEQRPQQTNLKHLLRPTRNKATVTMATIPTPTQHDNETFF